MNVYLMEILNIDVKRVDYTNKLNKLLKKNFRKNKLLEKSLNNFNFNFIF